MGALAIEIRRRLEAGDSPDQAVNAMQKAAAALLGSAAPAWLHEAVSTGIRTVAPAASRIRTEPPAKAATPSRLAARIPAGLLDDEDDDGEEVAEDEPREADVVAVSPHLRLTLAAAFAGAELLTLPMAQGKRLRDATVTDLTIERNGAADSARNFGSYAEFLERVRMGLAAHERNTGRKALTVGGVYSEKQLDQVRRQVSARLGV